MPDPSNRRHLFFLLAALALLMGSVDSTIVAVAVPVLGGALDASLTWVGWTLTAYLVVQIIMLPVAGKLSDSFGRKPVFVFCLGTFTLGSLLCGLAPSIGWLIAFRAIQAIGGGGLTPSAIGIVADQYRTRRAQAIGLFTSVAPIGAILGPNLGGLILAHWTWRLLFLINVPVGVVVLAGVLLLLVERPAVRKPALALDLIGLGMYAAAIVATLTALSLTGDDPTLWWDPRLWALFAIGGGSGALFLRHVARTRDPLVDPRFLMQSPFLPANLYSFAYGACTFGFFSFIPLYAVARFGLSTFESGAVLTPRAVAMIATSAVASLLIARTGHRKPMLAGMGLIVLTLLVLSRGWTALDAGGVELGGFWFMALIILISGVGVGLAGPASSNATLDLAPECAAALSSVRSMFSLTGGALSVTAIVLVLSASPDAAGGLERMFEVLCGVILLAALLACRIPDRAQLELRRQTHPVRVVAPHPVRQPRPAIRAARAA